MKASNDRNEKVNPQSLNLRQSLEKGIASDDKIENESSSDLRRQVEALQKNLMEMKMQYEARFNNLEMQSLIKDDGDEEAFPDDDGAFSGADDDDDENEVDTLVSDSFSLIMVSNKCSAPWLLGISTFLLQVLLCTFIAINQIQQSHNSSLFNVPFAVDKIVTVAQFLSIFFCVCIQSDVLESIQILSILWKDSNWKQVIPVQNRDDFGSWILHIFLPNFCKFLQGMLVLFISFVVIVQSDHIIDLFKDFSALTVISQLDDLVFFLARAGFIGRNLKSEAIKVEKIEFRESNGTRRNWFVIRPFILVAITATMVGGWMYIVIQQLNGSIFHARYPDCDASFLDAKTHFGDGKCYGGNLNTLGCEFEDGDCVNFNIQYPLCRGDYLVNVQEELANDECNMDFGIPDCDFDNFACCDKEIVKSASFGDGLCTAGKANTEQCMFDNNDCVLFNLNFPLCPVLEAVGNDGTILGDGTCNGGLYNTFDCGYENGDCEKSQLGQDLVFNGAFNRTSLQVNIFTVLSLDGSTMAVGLPATNAQDIFDDNSGGRVRIFKYDKDRMEWLQNIPDLIDDDGGILFGRKLSIDENGSRVAISGGQLGQEYIKVFDITEDSFQQIGQTLMRGLGSTRSLSVLKESSWSFDITASGSRLAVASDKQVQVFDLLEEDESSSKWTQIGDPILDDGIFFVRLNADDGSKLVYDKLIRYLYGHSDVITEVFSLRDNAWTQIDELLSSRNYGQLSTGVASAISGNGEIIVKSVNCNNPDTPGSVQAYIVRDEDVQSFGVTIERTDSEFGCSIALSRDGMNLAVSSLNYECIEGPDTCATGSIELFARSQYFFFPMITKNKFETNTITSQKHSSSNIFGFQASLGESEEDSLILSSAYFNFGDGKTAIVVYDLEKEFYPGCGMDPDFISQEGLCDSLYNTEECSYDLGECDEFNSMYPDCNVEYPYHVGDGRCDLGDYNTEECKWDGGDCVEFNKFPNCTVTSFDMSSLGNNRCDARHNTVDCGFDLGDCIEFNTKYPNCTASSPSNVEDGVCNSQYNISTCGWDGGDCL